MSDQIPFEMSMLGHKARFYEWFDKEFQNENYLLQFKGPKYDMIVSCLKLKEECSTSTRIYENLRASFPLANQMYPELKFSAYCDYMQKFSIVETTDGDNTWITLLKECPETSKWSARKETIIPYEKVFDWLYSRHISGEGGLCATRASLLQTIEEEGVCLGAKVWKGFLYGCFQCHPGAWCKYQLDNPDRATVMVTRSTITLCRAEPTRLWTRTKDRRDSVDGDTQQTKSEVVDIALLPLTTENQLQVSASKYTSASKGKKRKPTVLSPATSIQEKQKTKATLRSCNDSISIGRSRNQPNVHTSVISENAVQYYSTTSRATIEEVVALNNSTSLELSSFVYAKQSVH